MLYMQMMVERNNLQKILSFSIVLIYFYFSVFVLIYISFLFNLFYFLLFIYLFTFVNFARNDGEREFLIGVFYKSYSDFLVYIDGFFFLCLMHIVYMLN
jgi:hypothetical protein